MFRLLTLAFALLLASSVFGQTAPKQADPSPEMLEAQRLNALVADLYKKEKYSEALEFAEAALKLEREISKGPSERIAVTLTNVGELRVLRKHYREAETALSEALSIYQSLKDWARAGSVAERLAIVSAQLKKQDAAITYMTHSLSNREKVFENDSEIIGKTVMELARAYQAANQLDKSEMFFERALKIVEKVYGPTDQRTINAMKEYACMDIAQWVVGKPREKEHVRKPLKAKAKCWLAGFEEHCEIDNTPVASPVEDTFLNGRALRLAKPSYPLEARLQRLSGRVFVAVMINGAGKVVEARAICDSNPILAASSLESARKSTFSPTLVSGKPTRVSGFIIYNFVSL